MKHDRVAQIVVVVAMALLVPFLVGYTGPSSNLATAVVVQGTPTPIPTPTPWIKAADMRLVMAERFVDLHNAYLASDGPKYTSLLRATLRHARRLEPAQCVVFQSQLVEIANQVGYDGLEPVWLVYQDCAASDNSASLRSQRQKNALLFKQGLRFVREPLLQLPLRVTYWNSTVERGTRGDAVRVLLRQFARAQHVTAQSWGIRQLLTQPTTHAALCGLPVRLDQYGKTALPELLRRTGCLTGAGAEPKDICDKVFPQDSSNGTTPKLPAGISNEDKGRLQDFCKGLTGTGSAGSAGIDDLDAYSSDQCTSEDSTRLYETEKIVDLVLECYFSDSGSPLAEGVTSANYDQFLNQIVTWELDSGRYEASLMTGKAHDDPGRKFEAAVGDTPEQAREDLFDKLVSSPPTGYSGFRTSDGIGLERITVNEDGSYEQEKVFHNSDGTSNSSLHEYDANDQMTRSTETETDRDGNTTTKITEYERDDEGTIVGTTETVTHTDKDGKTETTRTRYDQDKEPVSVETWSGTTTPSDPASFDPHNPACQDLMGLDIMPEGSRSTFWNDLFSRPYRSDPRTVKPEPDQEAGWSQEAFCGAPGLGSNNARSRCRTPVMCAPGTYLGDSCTCQQQTGGEVTLKGCATATCPNGTVPVPVGANACQCQTGDSSAPGTRPWPGPRPDAARAFSELIWNRQGGELFVTDEMVRRDNLPRESVSR